MVFPQLHFLYEVIDVPGMQVVQVRLCVQPMVRLFKQTIEIPCCCIWWSMSLLRWSCISLVVAQRQNYMVQTARRTTDNSQLRVDKVVDAPIYRWCEFHGCRRGEDSCAPTVAPAQKLVTCSSGLMGRLF